MRSQEAYEKAVQGLLGPDGKSLPILTGLRCIRFEPPSFTLGKQCSIHHTDGLTSHFKNTDLVLILYFFNYLQRCSV